MRAALVGLLLLTPAAFADSPGKVPKGEPGAADRPVGAWILDLRNGPDAKRITALNRLAELGPKAREAVPDLVASLSHPEERVRNLAVEALGSIGPGAKAAAPTLRNFLGQSEEYYFKRLVAVALFQITNALDKDLIRVMIVGGGGKRVDPCGEIIQQNIKAVVPLAVELFGDIDPQVRLSAVRLLGSLGHAPHGQPSMLNQLGAEAQVIGPALVGALDDMDPDVAKTAALGLVVVEPKLCARAVPYALRAVKAGQLPEYEATTLLKPAAAVAVPAFIQALDEKDDAVRDRYARILACLEEARLPLEKALKDGKPERRVGAAAALGYRFSEGTSSAPALAAALRDDERSVRFAAAEALIQIGTRQAETVPALTEVILEGEERQQQNAAQLLTRIGPPAKSAVPHLIRALRADRPEVRFESALAIAAIDPGEASRVVPALVEGLDRAGLSAPTRAAAALANLGPAARPALPRLLPLLEDKEPRLAICAAAAVARIDPSLAPRASRTIGEFLLAPRRASYSIRATAIQTLRGLGPDARAALPALLFILQDEDGPCLPQAALAAVEIDAARADAAVAFIREALIEDKHGDDVYDLLDELPKLGPKAKVFLPELKQILASRKRPRHDVEAAALTLAAIGPEARDAVPLLRERLKTEKGTDCREAIKQALAALTEEKR
jgi:HEAT repeat protein